MLRVWNCVGTGIKFLISGFLLHRNEVFTLQSGLQSKPSNRLFLPLLVFLCLWLQSSWPDSNSFSEMIASCIFGIICCYDHSNKQNTVLPNAFAQGLHLVVVMHMVGIVLEWLSQSLQRRSCCVSFLRSAEKKMGIELIFSRMVWLPSYFLRGVFLQIIVCLSIININLRFQKTDKNFWNFYENQAEW